MISADPDDTPVAAIIAPTKIVAGVESVLLRAIDEGGCLKNLDGNLHCFPPRTEYLYLNLHRDFSMKMPLEIKREFHLAVGNKPMKHRTPLWPSENLIN